MGEISRDKKLVTLTFLIGLLAPLFASPASAATDCNLTKKSDRDGNGIGDAGVQVVCNWDSYYAEDASGAYYLDLGDGRINTSAGVSSPQDLDPLTVEECFYRNHSRGDYGNTPSLDSGEVRNNIRCVGPEGVTTYNYVIVSSDHHRYTGNPEWVEWGTWEYVVFTQSGEGNLIAPPQD